MLNASEIVGGCRHRLTKKDIEFIQETLGRDAGNQAAIIQLAADEESLDTLLDDEKLYHRILEAPSHLEISAELYFYVMVRHSFLKEGIEDIQIADYVASVLAGHARKRAHPFRNGQGPSSIDYGVDLLTAIHEADGYHKFELCVYTGNRFLFLTGIYLEYLNRRQRRWGGPSVDYYEGIGRNAFLTARDHPLAREFDVRELYDNLGVNFGRTRQILNDIGERLLCLE